MVYPNRWGGRYAKFERFGFGDDGTIVLSGYSFQGKTPKTILFSYICEESKVNEMRSDQALNRICASYPDSSNDCLIVPFNSTEYSFDIKTRKLLYFTVVDCSDVTGGQQAEVTYTLLSTNGNQVSLEYLPLPIFYVVITAVWIFVLLGWVLLYLKNKVGRTPLHLMILVVILIKLAVTLISMFYWVVYSLNGNRYDLLYNSQSFLYALSETTFFCALYLISRGWRITRSGIPAAELRSTAVALVVLLCTLLFFSFYNTEYYYLSLIIMYFFIVPKVFTSFTQNIRMLEAYSQTILNANITEDELAFYNTHLNSRINAFVKGRNQIVVYLSCMLIVNSLVKVLISWDYLWVVTFSIEIITICFYCFTFWLFRPSKYIFFTKRSDMVPFVALRSLSDREGRENREGRGLSEWDLTKTLVVEWPIGKQTKLSLAYEESYYEQLETITL